MGVKDKGDIEDEYFHRLEQEKLAKLREQAEADKVVADADALKAQHYLRCGKCGNKMDTQVFRGIEIEICPVCGAVLLDAGELQQLAGQDSTGIVNFVSELFSFKKAKD